MGAKKINNTGQARIFKNGFLEALTKTRPWVIYTIYLPLCSYLIYYSYAELDFSAGLILGLFFFAMLSWTLFEYAVHRFLFHFGRLERNFFEHFFQNRVQASRSDILGLLIHHRRKARDRRYGVLATPSVET